MAGEAAGAAGAMSIANRLGQRSGVRRLNAQMPLIVDAMRDYQRAVAKANKANTPLSRVQLAGAKAAITATLAPLGIQPDSLSVLPQQP
jgi:hypothetical protein